jgi:hypothetical protein
MAPALPGSARLSQPGGLASAHKTRFDAAVLAA